jgi:hypothetical protein
MEKRIWEWEVDQPWKKFALEARATTVQVYRNINSVRSNSDRITDPRIPDIRDFEAAFEIPIKRLIVEATLRLAKSIVSDEAQRKGRILFLLELTTDCYAELKELDRMEAQRKRPLENDPRQ